MISAVIAPCGGKGTNTVAGGGVRGRAIDAGDVGGGGARSVAAGQPFLDPRKLVFIDEAGRAAIMARRRDRCPHGQRLKGQRLKGQVPHGRWKMTTFTEGLRVDRLTAPMTLDGPMNGERLLA